MEPDIQTTSTSPRSADATPVALREGDQTRLVFLPQLVTNESNPEASVRGTLCWQRKNRRGNWEPVGAINLAGLRAGEGVRLELNSAEVLGLFRHLSNLYAVAEQHGVQFGTRQFVQTPRSEQLRTLLQDGSLDELLDADDTGLLRGFLDWLARTDTSDLAERLATVEAPQLVNFDAAIGVARLKSFIAEYEGNRSRREESYWQGLLQQHSWVISQVFAFPCVLIRGQAYVGGKQIDNRGGNIVDFLYASALTENAVLVEIKTPATPLLEPGEYRNNTYNLSRELSGATQQLLVDKSSLITEYRALSGDEQPAYRPFSPRTLLIIGDTQSLPGAAAARRSFELYRNNLRDVDVITYDELAEKIGRLVDLLEQRSAPSEGDDWAPF